MTEDKSETGGGSVAEGLRDVVRAAAREQLTIRDAMAVKFTVTPPPDPER